MPGTGGLDGRVQEAGHVRDGAVERARALQRTEFQGMWACPPHRVPPRTPVGPPRAVPR